MQNVDPFDPSLWEDEDQDEKDPFAEQNWQTQDEQQSYEDPFAPEKWESESEPTPPAPRAPSAPAAPRPSTSVSGAIAAIPKRLGAGAIGAATALNKWIIGPAARMAMNIEPGAPNLLETPEGQKLTAYLKQKTITEPEQTAQRLREETPVTGLPTEILYGTTEAVGGLVPSMMAFDVPIGSAVKATTQATALLSPRVASALAEIPDFAYGMGVRAGVEQIQKEPTFKGGLKAIAKAGEAVALGTLYGKIGEGSPVTAIPKFGVAGAGEAAASAMEQGRLPTRKELESGFANGAAFGLAFGLLPLMRRVVAVPAEKKALGELIPGVNDAVKRGDSEAFGKVVDKFFKSRFVRPKVKQAVAEALKVTSRSLDPEASKQAALNMAQAYEAGSLTKDDLNYIKQTFSYNPILTAAVDNLLAGEKPTGTGENIFRPRIPEKAGPGVTDKDVKSARDLVSKLRRDHESGTIDDDQLQAVRDGIPDDHPLAEQIRAEIDRIAEAAREKRQQEKEPVDLINLTEIVPPLNRAEDSARAFEEAAAKEEYVRKSLAGLMALQGQLAKEQEKANVEGLQGLVPYIKDILSQVRMGEPGGRVRLDQYGPGTEWRGYASTYPAVMTENGFGAKETIKAIEKGLSGYEFPERESRQRAIWEAVLEAAKEQRKPDIISAAEHIEQEPQAIEGMSDADYATLIQELQDEGYSTRDIEEAAARFRKPIETSVIRSIAADTGFSPGEIRAILADESEPEADLDAAWQEAMQFYPPPATEGMIHDQEREERLAGVQREGEAPGGTLPNEGPGPAPTETVRVVQEPSNDQEKQALEEEGALVPPNSLTVRTKDDKVYALPIDKGTTHADILDRFDLNPDDVVDTGLTTKDGAEVWGGGPEVKGLKKPVIPAAVGPLTPPTEHASGLVAKIKAYEGGEHSPTKVRLFQELGSSIVPGVRLQDAEEAGRMYYAYMTRGIDLKDWQTYVEDLKASNKIKKPAEPWKTDHLHMEPREYQERYPEITVHEDWDKASSPRFILEAAGDIIREFQKPHPDALYIEEKLARVDRLIRGELSGNIHPDDSMEAARKHEPEKLARLISQYEYQPTKGEAQELATSAILSLMKRDFKAAKAKYARIRKIIEEAPAGRNEAEEIGKAASEAEEEPSEAQIEAGNYKKGHIGVNGVDITIENRAGSVRRSKPGAKKQWENVLTAHYGYIRGTKGNDGDQVDAFINPDPYGGSIGVAPVFVVNQVNPETGKFDEHKVMLGYVSGKEAKEAYLSNYEKGWKGLGSIVHMTWPDFKDWLANGDFSEQVKWRGYHGPERRSDYGRRKRVEEMTLEEARKELLTDSLTGLPNRRAYEEAEKTPYQAFIDVDSLKWVNDEIGHDAGDVLLKAMGDALKTVKNADPFRISGDEFKLLAQSEDDLHAAAAQANKYLTENPLKFNLTGGRTVTLTGAFSYGTGATPAEAEEALQRAKNERELQGERAARGEKPPGVVEGVAPGNKGAPQGEAGGGKKLAVPEGWEPIPGSGGSIRSPYGDYIISGTPGEYRLTEETHGHVIGGTFTDLSTAAKRANQHWIETQRGGGKEELEVLGPADIGTVGNLDVPALSEHFLHMIDPSKKPLNKVKVQKAVADLLGITRAALVKNPEYKHKQVEEAFEYAIVKKAREIIDKGASLEKTYKQLKELYDWQPNLGTRTSTSVKLQEYSTPIHLAYLMQRMVGITPSTKVYEPTAGNGALVTTAKPKNVMANEIDPTRKVTLADQGFKVSEANAEHAVGRGGGPSRTPVAPRSADVVVANPPFGGGAWKEIDGYSIKMLEHKIVMNALEAMKDRGKAAFIIGNKNFRKGKLPDTERIFLNWLHKNYNVIRNIQIPGPEYARQGTKFPVRLIVVHGRRPGNVRADVFASDEPSDRREYQSVKSVDELVDETRRVLDGRETGLAAADGSMEILKPAPEIRFSDEEPPAIPGTKPARLPGALASEGGRPSGGVPGAAGEEGAVPPSGELLAGAGVPTGAGHGAGGAGAVHGGAGLPTPEHGGVRTPAPHAGGNEPSGVQGAGALPERGAGQRPKPGRGGRGSKGNEPAGAAGTHEPGLAEVTPTELLDLFDEGVREQKQAEPQEKQPEEKTPAESAKEHAKATAKYLKDLAKAAKEINELLGEEGEILPPADLDVAKWNKIKAVLNDLWQSAVAAAKSAKEFVSDVIKLLGEKGRKYFAHWLQAEFPKLQADLAKTTEGDVKPVQFEETITEYQATYHPKSNGRIIDETLTPRTMRDALEKALDNLEVAVGDIDDYVTTKLKYPDKEALFNALSADQIDAVALSIYNLEQHNAATIIGDQTGVGKGRIAASMYRYARLQGAKPIFFTEKGNLFSDFYRDMTDIGGTINPYIMASDKDKGTVTNKTGQVVLKPLLGEKRKAMLRNLAATGVDALAGYDGILTTYSQINIQASLAQRAIAQVVQGNYIILDESHNASGAESNTGEFLREALRHAKGVIYLSATYAKRADTIPIYFRTDLSRANLSMDDLIDAVTNGGTPLQEITSAYLAERGQLLRREKSFKGISPHFEVDTKNRVSDEAKADQMTQHMRDIIAFDNELIAAIKSQTKKPKGAKGKHWTPPPSVFGVPIPGSVIQGGHRIHSTVTVSNFASTVHNAVRALLVCMKAKAGAEQAIKEIKAGRKPIIAISNTMGSFLKEQIEDVGIMKIGDPIGSLTFSDILQRYLARTLYVSVKGPGDRKATRYPISLDDLPGPLKAEYKRIEKNIANTMTDIPGSPIDYLLGTLRDAGYRFAEITGRDYVGDLEQPDMPLRKRSSEEINDRNSILREFNNGAIDGLIINRAASAGVSAHSSPEFKDQRPRSYVGIQPELNVDHEVQKMGRINRKGQVNIPRYVFLQLDLPAEIRPTAILIKKMRSLSANTSANSDSPLAQLNVPDIMNKYGDEIVSEWLQQNPHIAGEIGVDPSEVNNIAVKATGKIALLPIAEQRRFYEEVETAYNAYIQRLKEEDLYDLQVDDLDFKARTISTTTLTVGTDESNPFGKSTRLEELRVVSDKKPYKVKRIQRMLDALADAHGGSLEQYTADMLRDLKAVHSDYLSEKEQQAARQKDQAAARKRLDGIKTAMVRVEDKFRSGMYPVGGTYEIKVSDQLSMRGVLIAIDAPRPGRAVNGNPAALGNISLVFAVDNALQRYPVSLSKIDQGETRVELIDTSIAPDWDERMGRDIRVKRFMITGNLIQGFADTPKGARIVRFTMENGTTREGILLPLSYSPPLSASRTVRVTKDLVNQFLADHTLDTLSSPRINLQWRPADELYTLRVPRSKKLGGIFFLDETLRDLSVTGEFETVGKFMQAHFPESAREALVERLYELGEGFSVPYAVYAASGHGTPETEGGPSTTSARPAPPGPSPWPKDFPPVVAHSTIRKMKDHPDYEAAKGGSIDAAMRVVDNLVKPERLQALAKRHPNAVVVPVIAVEQAGINKLPIAYAAAIEGVTGLKSELGIVQANKSGHTGASALTRILTPGIFEGPVTPGQEYIIADDVVTSGGTARELRRYIEQGGGKVVEVSAIALAKFASRIQPAGKMLAKIEDKLGRQNVENILTEYGATGTLESFTQSQLREISKYGSIDTLRDRLAQERSRVGVPPSTGILSAAQTGLTGPEVPKEITPGDIQDAAKAITIAAGIIRKTLPPSLWDNIDLRIHPTLTYQELLRLSGNAKQLERSLQEHGGRLDKLYGAATVNNMGAIVRLSQAQTPEDFEGTAYHEAFHVVAKWLIPDKDYAALMDFYKDNEEAAANDFSRFARANSAKELNGKPSFIKRIFAMLNRIIRAIKAKLGDKGARIAQIFDNILNQSYEPLSEAEKTARHAWPQRETRYRRDKGYEPKKTVTAYKLFRILKSRPGELFPLFIGKATPVPMDEWLEAKYIPTKGYAPRPGWHAGELPIAPHLRQKSTGKINKDRVWAEVEMPADRDWQAKADAMETGDLRGTIPKNGFYRFKTSKMQGGAWMIGGAMKVKRILSDSDVYDILKSAGYSDKDILPELKGKQPPKKDRAQWGVALAKAREKAPPLYSKLTRLVEANKETMPTKPQSILNWLKKNQVKPAELKWMGVEGWLKQNAGKHGKVDRDELAAYLRSNEIHLTEITREGEENRYPELFSPADVRVYTYEKTAKEKGVQIEGITAEYFGNMAHFSYFFEAKRKSDTEPWLVYNPNQEGWSRTVEGSIDNVKDFIRHFVFDEQHTPPGTVGKLPTKFPDWTVIKGSAALRAEKGYKELLFTLPIDYTHGETYTGRHWTEPNVLFHARIFDNITTPQGDKVFYVDEVQSDWLQQAKKEGFTRTETQSTYHLEPTREGIPAGGGRTFISEQTADDALTLALDRHNRARPAYDQLTPEDYMIVETKTPIKRGVATAPFLESWPTLAMKRMLRHAVEKGAAYMAWSTGSIQADRYSLAKYINSIHYIRRKKGGRDLYEVYVKDKKGDVIQGLNRYYTEQQLAETFGKEIAKKIVATADPLVLPSGATGKVREIKGVDLVVGGEGMREFYDRQLVNFMKKYTRQWGGKVRQIPIVTKPKERQVVHAVKITPEMREDVLYTGQTMFRPAPKAKDDLKEWATKYIADTMKNASSPGATKEDHAKAERLKEEQRHMRENWNKDLKDSMVTALKHYRKIAKTGWQPERPDTTFLERLLQSPEFYFEKVPAAQRVLEARLAKPENFRQHLADITENDKLLEDIKALKKSNPAEYERYAKLITDADQRKNNLSEADLKEMGFSDQAVKAWTAYRQIMNHGFDKLYAEMLDIIESYEKVGLEVPSVVTWVDGKKVKINLKVALAMMGDMRGYYAPRIRKPGKWMIVGTKKGAHPHMEFRDTIVNANLLHAKLAKQGYVVRKSKAKNIPEDVFEMAGQTIALGAMVNAAFERVASQKGPTTLDTYGLKGELVETATGPDYQVRGPFNKRMTTVFKAMGGKWYAKDQAWHFKNPGKGFEERLTNALSNMMAGIGPYDTEPLFAYSIATELANIVKGRGFRSRMIKRNEKTGIDVWEGYETDPLTAAAQYAASIAAGMAKKEMASAMTKAVTGTDIEPSDFDSYEDYLAEVKARRIDPASQKNIFHDVKVYMEETLRNQEFSDRVIGLVKAITVFKYLGFRVASPAVNLTALATSVPAALNEYAGLPLRKAPALLANAIGYFMKYRFGDRTQLKPEINAMFDNFEAKGWTEAQFKNEALAVLQSRVGAATRAVLDWSMFMFGATEKLNRASTLAAAYLAARDAGRSVEDSFKIAKKVSDRAHGIYMGNAALPHYAQGQNIFAKMAKMFYVFSKFSHTYLQTMYEIGWKRKNRKALLYMMFAPAVIAGAGGMVGWSLLMAVAKKILGVDDPEEAIYNFLAGTFGSWADYLARFGLMGLLGWGVSLKGSLQIDMVGSVPTTIPELLGAPGSIYTDTKMAAQSAARGQWARAAERFLPSFAAAPIKAAREYREGVTTTGGVPKLLHGKKMMATPLDTVYRSLSFNPAHMAAQKEKKWSETKLRKSYSERRGDIYARLRAYYSVPPERRSRAVYEDILMDIKDYNDRVRAGQFHKKGVSFITSTSISRALKVTR